MTEHLDRAIEAGWDAYWTEVKRDDKSRLMDYRASYRAFTAALLEGLTPEHIVGPPSPTATDLGREYRLGMLRGAELLLAAIRERAGLGGNDDPA